MTASSIAHPSALARSGHHGTALTSPTTAASAEFTDLIGSFLECFTFSAEQEPVDSTPTTPFGKATGNNGKKDSTASSSGDAQQDEEPQGSDSVQALLVAVPVLPQQPVTAPVTWQLGLARDTEQQSPQGASEPQEKVQRDAASAAVDPASLLVGTTVSVPLQTPTGGSGSPQDATQNLPQSRPEPTSTFTIDLSDRPKIQNQTPSDRVGVHAFEVRLTENRTSARDTNIAEQPGDASLAVDSAQTGETARAGSPTADREPAATAAKLAASTPLPKAPGAPPVKDSPREGQVNAGAKQAGSPNIGAETARRPAVQPTKKIEPGVGREKGQPEETASEANNAARHAGEPRITTQGFATDHLKASADREQGSVELQAGTDSVHAAAASAKADFEPTRGEASKAVEDITVRVDAPGSASPVEIRLKQDGESIRVSATTGDADTASTLHNHVPEMKRDLQSHGWNAEALESSGEISTHSTESGGSSGNHPHEGERGQQMHDASEGRQQRQGRQLADWQDAYDSQSDGFRFTTFTSRGVNH